MGLGVNFNISAFNVQRCNVQRCSTTASHSHAQNSDTPDPAGLVLVTSEFNDKVYKIDDDDNADP